MRSCRSDGLLLVDKSAGMTSHDVVALARRTLGERRIGHTGTLDPFATGLLVLLIGRSTRLARYIDSEPKVYDATISFGAETTTDDLTGEVTRTAPPPERAAVERAIRELTGELDQVPPSYSAKHVAGERAYAAARRGDSLVLPAVRVTVHGWRCTAWRESELDARITCSGGTYIRALARDLGRIASSAGHLSALRRTASGPFTVDDAVSVQALRDGEAMLHSPLSALSSMPVVALDEPDIARVLRGVPVPARVSGAWAALVDAASELVAVAERVDELWQPRVVLRDA